jgi:putative transposase
MKRKRHSRADIRLKLREANADLAAGMAQDEVCAKLGVSLQTLQRWLRSSSETSEGEVARLKRLEIENRKLRKALTEMKTEQQILAEVARGNF